MDSLPPSNPGMRFSRSYSHNPSANERNGHVHFFSPITHPKITLPQSRSAAAQFPTDATNILGAINHDILDDFQLQLHQWLQSSSDAFVTSYTQKKFAMLHRFLWSLFIASMDKSHALRRSSNDEADFMHEFQQELHESHSYGNGTGTGNGNGIQGLRLNLSNSSSANNNNNVPSSPTGQRRQISLQRPQSPQTPRRHNHPHPHHHQAPNPFSPKQTHASQQQQQQQPPFRVVQPPPSLHQQHSQHRHPHQHQPHSQHHAHHLTHPPRPRTPQPQSKPKPKSKPRTHTPGPIHPLAGVRSVPSPTPNHHAPSTPTKPETPSRCRYSTHVQHNPMFDSDRESGGDRGDLGDLAAQQMSGYQIRPKPLLKLHSEKRRVKPNERERPLSAKNSRTTMTTITKKRTSEVVSFAKFGKMREKMKEKMQGFAIDDEKEKLLVEKPAEIIAPMTMVRGVLRITDQCIAFIPDAEQPDTTRGGVNLNLALHPPSLECAVDNSSFERAQQQFPDHIGQDDIYWVAVNAQSSYEQVGGSRYKQKNAKNVWFIASVTEIYYRRYQGRDTAFEVFLNDDTSWMFNVLKDKHRDLCFNAIIDQKPPNLIDEVSTFKNPRKALKSSKMHQRWCARDMSNFEYVMRVNLLAGRTFNDLEQYPVVPWILSDYEADEIDLADPKNYRDLRKPMGAQNEERLHKFKERYALMQEDAPRFMYGTHYSTKAIVLYYLIRMEPFATYNRLFQGGKFDTADRLFASIAKTWRGCMRSTSDVKELIPEFFYMTDFLQNQQRLDFGVTQNGHQRVDHVELPPWAKGSYTLFTRTLRSAFESEYVSRHLHHWIDLVFGYKQCGKEAEDADNVFHPYTYQENVELDKISDQEEREVILQTIAEFGQTPTQLFKKAHRARLKGTDVAQNIFRAQWLKFYGAFACTTPEMETYADWVSLGVAYIAMRTHNAVLTIASNGTVDLHKLKTSHDAQFSIVRKDKASLALFSNLNPQQSLKKVSNYIFLKNLCFAVTANGSHVFAAGFEDCTFIQYNVAQEKQEAEFRAHSDIVSCIAIDEDANKNRMVVVTGSYDCSIIVWKGQLEKKRHTRTLSASYSALQLQLELHESYRREQLDAAVNCVDVSMEKGVIVVGTTHGDLIMYHSSKGDVLWSTSVVQNIAICRVSKTFGTVLVYCCDYEQQPTKLYLFSDSGELLNECVVADNDRYHEVVFSKSGNHVCCGGLNKCIAIYKVPSFQMTRQLKDANDIIRSLTTDKDDKYILCGLNNGNVLLYSFPESAQKDASKNRKSLYGTTSKFV